MAESTEPQTLAEFVLARVAEDEHDADMLESDANASGYSRFIERTRRGCEAKRALIRAHETHCAGYHDWPNTTPVEPRREARTGLDAGLWHAIRLAALAFADHPEFRPGWRP